MRRSFALIALTALLWMRPAGGQTPYSLRQYLSIRGAGSPTIAPDGSQIAFRTTITGISQAWTVSAPLAWPDQLTFFPSSISGLRWSPGGEWILVTADRDGNEQFQFYLVKPDGTQIVPLTDNPKVRYQFGGWSVDGKQIYYASNARDPRYFDCYVMDVATKQERRIFQKDAILGAAALSRDGRLMVADQATSNVNNDVYVVDVATGQARLLTPHTGDATYRVVDFAPDGKALYIATDQDRDFINLARIDLATGTLHYLQSESYDVENATLSPDGRRLAFTMNREGYEELMIWDLPSQHPVRLPALPHGVVTPGDFTHDGRKLALSINTPAQTADVWLLDVPGARVTRMTRSSMAGIDTTGFVEPSLIHYKSFDGREIPAFFYLPKNAPQDHSLPVILEVHGGPEAQERPFFAPLRQYFVSRGYAVVAPNIRGSSGYGKAYLALDNTVKRWDALKDLSAAVDWIATQPALSPRKVAIMGGSYGGFAVLAMLVHYPERFAAGIDMFGIADFKSFLANTAPFRRPLRAAEYGDPEKDSEFLDAISPLRHADRIVAPLMVVQGVNDPRVPQTESAQIVQKVKAKGGVVEYLLFPDEGHGIAKLPNRIRAFESMVAFLNKHFRQD